MIRELAVGWVFLMLWYHSDGPKCKVLLTVNIILCSHPPSLFAVPALWYGKGTPVRLLPKLLVRLIITDIIKTNIWVVAMKGRWTGGKLCCWTNGLERDDSHERRLPASWTWTFPNCVKRKYELKHVAHFTSGFVEYPQRFFFFLYVLEAIGTSWSSTHA